MKSIAKSVQLNLFTWDDERMGEGYDGLERLDFKRARNAFEGIIENIEDHQKAQQGLTLCEDWELVLDKAERLDPINASEFLWKAITDYDFGTTSLPMTLKKALLKKLAADVQQISSNLLSDSGLCLGQVFLEYGNTLWHPEEKIQAKINYIKALLIAPSEIASLLTKDEEIADLIEDAGPYLAPIYEWMNHGMPALEIPKIRGENPEHIDALEIYDKLIQINEMKGKGDHQMVTFRKELKLQAPKIFAAYMKNQNGVNSKFS